MTATKSQWTAWRWADPRWWAERQLEAAACMMRLTGAVVDASISSISSVLGATGRTAPRPVASVPAPVAETAAPAAEAAAPVTAPAPPPAPVLVKPDTTERAPAGDPVVPGWDELTLGSIRARLRRLSEDDLAALHDYEERHAARPDVLSMLSNRLSKVRSADQGS